MATACLFIGWNRPFAGREKEAFGFLMGDGRGMLEQFQRQGYYERKETIALTAHGGDLNGFILLFGERAKLDELRRTDDFERFAMRMGSLFDNYGVVPGLNAEGIQKVMERNPMGL